MCLKGRQLVKLVGACVFKTWQGQLAPSQLNTSAFPAAYPTHTQPLSCFCACMFAFFSPQLCRS